MSQSNILASAPATRRESDYRIPGELWTRGRNALVFALLAGAAASVAGFVGDPKQFTASWLVAFLFCTTVCLGGMFFVMIQFLTGSAWSVTVRRLMENIAVTIPLGAVAFLPIGFGLHYLYAWSNRDLMHKDPTLVDKASYLSPEWFWIRAAIYFTLWTLFALSIYRASTSQDSTRHIRFMNIASRWSAPGLLMVMVTATLAAFDWIMSLNPHWYSTIFGIYVLGGGALAFFGVLTSICLRFRNAGVLSRYINEEHYHDLGKWLFALTVFWAYIGFSQYLLIWYSNLPEETVFFHDRVRGSWVYISAALPLFHFLVPFLVLMPRSSKRNFKLLAVMSVYLAFMHYLDLYWMVMPAVKPEGFAPHWLDLSCFATVFALFGLGFWYRLRAHALMPVGDLRFEQSLGFENL